MRCHELRKLLIVGILGCVGTTIWMLSRLKSYDKIKDHAHFRYPLKLAPTNRKRVNGNGITAQGNTTLLLSTSYTINTSSNHSQQDPTCLAVMRQNRASKHWQHLEHTFLAASYIPDKDYVNLTKDCQDFKLKRGYHVTPVSQLEAEFPIAYNILMHKDLYQMEFLLRAIYRPQNVYCIHVDAGQSKRLLQGVQSLVRCFHNVYIASKLERVIYAGFSRLQADINCMENHLKSNVSWKYLINIAAQSFPLKTNEEIVKILKIYNGANDIEGISGSRIIRQRFEWEWEEIIKRSGNKIAKTKRKNPPPPHGLSIVRGSAYGVFSRAFVEFVIHNEVAQDLLEWSRKTNSPDEHYWATLHHTYNNTQLNTPGGYTDVPDNKSWLAVFVSWKQTDPCHGKWRHYICIFGTGDLSTLIHRPELFSNKFYYDYQPLTLHCLNDWLEHKVTCPQVLDEQYYNNLSFVYRDHG